MITIKEWMEVIDYRITEGDGFGWNCFGTDSYILSSWNGDHNGWSFSITFDTNSQTVFMVEACDYKNQRAYRRINPDWLKKFESHGTDQMRNQAWDGVDFVDLETDDDWIQKSLAIVEGRDYDTRVSIPLELSDEELLRYMKIAHERDITFNQLVEVALRAAMENHNSNPDEFTARAKKFKEGGIDVF